MWNKEKVQDINSLQSTFPMFRYWNQKRAKVVSIVMTSLVVLFVFGLIVYSNTDFLHQRNLDCNEESSPYSADCLKSYTEEIGMNERSFDKCFDEKEYSEKIDRDINIAKDLEVRGGPTVFVGEGDTNSIKGFYVAGGANSEEYTKWIDLVSQKGIDEAYQEYLNEKVGDIEELFTKFNDAYLAKGFSKVDAKAKADLSVENAIKTYALVDVDISDSEVIGNKDTKVVLVEFGDPICSYCKTFTKNIMQNLRDSYIDEGKLRYVYKYYVAEDVDPSTYNSSLALSCAAAQNKFWEYKSLLAEK